MVKLIVDCDLSDTGEHREDLKDQIKEAIENIDDIIVEKIRWED